MKTIEILVTRARKEEDKDYGFVTFTIPSMEGMDRQGGESEQISDARDAEVAVRNGPGMYTAEVSHSYETFYRQGKKGGYFPQGVYKLVVKNLTPVKAALAGGGSKKAEGATA